MVMASRVKALEHPAMEVETRIMSNTHGSSDLQHIRKALALFVRERDTVELRIPNSGKGTVSGYFDTLDAAAKAAAQWSGKVPAVYLTINPVNPTLLAAMKEAQVAAERGVQTTINMPAAFGRARWLGERVIGHQDPGAALVALMAASVVASLAKLAGGSRG